MYACTCCFAKIDLHFENESGWVHPLGMSLAFMQQPSLQFMSLPELDFQIRVPLCNMHSRRELYSVLKDLQCKGTIKESNVA